MCGWEWQYPPWLRSCFMIKCQLQFCLKEYWIIFQKVIFSSLKSPVPTIDKKSQSTPRIAEIVGQATKRLKSYDKRQNGWMPAQMSKSWKLTSTPMRLLSIPPLFLFRVIGINLSIFQLSSSKKGDTPCSHTYKYKARKSTSALWTVLCF